MQKRAKIKVHTQRFYLGWFLKIIGKNAPLPLESFPAESGGSHFAVKEVSS